MIRKKRKLSKNEEKGLKRAAAKQVLIESQNDASGIETNKQRDSVEIVKKIIEVPQVVTVRDFSVMLNLPVTRVIQELMKNGVMASINESIDLETAVIIGDELGFEIKNANVVEQKQQSLNSEQKKKLKTRPPVIVVLGHVDHGKTKLLDAIRKTDVVSEESGGITQHIGAYQVKVKSGKVKNKSEEKMLTFLDTPGHEAFSAMRAHGANMTDIAILVVAADDGVMPQTKEAISHAKAAEVPIIVAINKIDKPEADIDRVKRQLADMDLIPEEWGGKTIMVPVSAREGKNIEQLLDMIILTAELEDLKAFNFGPAEGIVIESHMQSGLGPVGTVLVQKGKLATGDLVVIGRTYGKIRSMEDFRGKRINCAGPSTPVKISGIKEVPSFGEFFKVVADEKTARNAATIKNVKVAKFGLAEISQKAGEGKLTILEVILKADAQGSLTALRTSVESIGVNEIKIKIISEGIGDITETDVNMAISAKALIVGFKVNLPTQVKKYADDKGVKVSLYDIIYNLIDEVTAALQGLIKPEFTEIKVGKLEVLKVFYSTKSNKIIGGKVVDGKMEKGLKAHLFHSGDLHGEGKVVSLKKEKLEVNEVERGMECGLSIETTAPIKPGDLVEVYTQEEHLKKIR